MTNQWKVSILYNDKSVEKKSSILHNDKSVESPVYYIYYILTNQWKVYYIMTNQWNKSVESILHNDKSSGKSSIVENKSVETPV